MQIHELNNFAGTLGSGAYLAIDDGTDTGKISSQGLLAATEARIDNIIAGPAPSAEEIVDARLGADGVTYPSLGDAIRDQFTDVKSELDDTNNIIDNSPISIAVVQGARGTDSSISANNKYCTSKKLFSYGVGNKLKITVTNSNIYAVITEWEIVNGAISYVGNVGSWASEINYDCVGRLFAVSFKGKNSQVITPADCTFTTEFVSKIWNTINTIGDSTAVLVSGDLIPYKSYIQGYYDTSGTWNSSSKYIVSPIKVVERDEFYVVPTTSSYDVAVYTWDYSEGVYSNFEQTGWIDSELTIKVPKGKAFSVLIRPAGGGSATIHPNISYAYYKKPIGEVAYELERSTTASKIACVGDSLTQGVDIGTHVIAENYPYFMGRMLGCSVLNYGVAGADTKEYWHDNMDDFTFDNTIDTVLIMLGTNGSGIPNTLETDVYPYTNYNDYADTYCGCYCKIIRKIIELTQNIAQVILITPPYSSYSTAQLNRVKEARETIKEVGLWFNVPVIDVFAECGMGAYNASVFRPHDGCHFNAKGYHRLGTFIGSKVKALHSEWSLDDEYSDETPIT